MIVDHGDHDGPSGLYSVSGVEIHHRALCGRTAPCGASSRAARARQSPAPPAEANSRRGCFPYDWDPATGGAADLSAIAALVEEEAVVHLDDLLFRRCGLGENRRRALELLPLLRPLIPWSDLRWQQECERAEKPPRRPRPRKMPLPIGHALAGIAFQRARPGFFFKGVWPDALFFIFLANLPDADFLPGILLGRPNLYHHGIFHSLGAALAVAAIGGGLFYLSKKRFWATAAGIFLVFYFHLLLDYFALDFVRPLRPALVLALFRPLFHRRQADLHQHHPLGAKPRFSSPACSAATTWRRRCARSSCWGDWRWSMILIRGRLGKKPSAR